MYKQYDQELDEKVETSVDKVLTVIVSELSSVTGNQYGSASSLLDVVRRRCPRDHWYTRWSDYGHATAETTDALSRLEIVCHNLGTLSDCLELAPDEVPTHLYEFQECGIRIDSAHCRTNRAI